MRYWPGGMRSAIAGSTTLPPLRERAELLRHDPGHLAEVDGLERDVGGGFFVLDQLGNRIGLEPQLELGQAIGLHDAQPVHVVRERRVLARALLLRLCQRQ